MSRPEPPIARPAHEPAPASRPAPPVFQSPARESEAASIGAFVVTAIFWMWQAGCLLVAVFMVMEMQAGPFSPLGAAWLLRDGIATWAMGSVGLAACRYMAR